MIAPTTNVKGTFDHFIAPKFESVRKLSSVLPHVYEDTPLRKIRSSTQSPVIKPTPGKPFLQQSMAPMTLENFTQNSITRPVRMRNTHESLNLSSAGGYMEEVQPPMISVPMITVPYNYGPLQ